MSEMSHRLVHTMSTSRGEMWGMGHFDKIHVQSRRHPRGALSTGIGTCTNWAWTSWITWSTSGDETQTSARQLPQENCWNSWCMMIDLLLFLQKQNLAFVVYLFGSVLSLHTHTHRTKVEKKTHVMMLSPWPYRFPGDSPTPWVNSVEY